MKQPFAKSGGRLFRIVTWFAGICIAAMVAMGIFTHRAMNDMHEIVMADKEIPMFYTQLINNMKPEAALGSLSAVIIAIAARYGLRETAKSYSEGQAARQNTPPPPTDPPPGA